MIDGSLPPLIVYWSRRDFRLTDNRALTQALLRAQEVNGEFLSLFVLEDYMRDPHAGGGFGVGSRQMLTLTLPPFLSRLPGHAIVTGKAVAYFERLKQSLGSRRMEVFVNEDIYPDFTTQLTKMKTSGIVVTLTQDRLTVPRGTKTGSGNTYSIFTPFRHAVWNTFLDADTLPPPTKRTLECVRGFSLLKHHTTHSALFRHHSFVPVSTAALAQLFPDSFGIQIDGVWIDLGALPLPMRSVTLPYTTEDEAWTHAKQFLDHQLGMYHEGRNMLAESATSHLSPALAWGLISARQIKAHITSTFGVVPEGSEGKLSGPATFLSELIWREFYAYLLHHDPLLLSRAFQVRHRTLSWAKKDTAQERFMAWIKGETGYEIVDAAMMEIWKTGWMHNRSRMIVSSILTKNFGVNWLWGQEYFRALLIDLDEASNCGGWQWGASVGADPKPVRIFNPYTQAKNFDPEGMYQKHWIPERTAHPIDPLVPHVDARQDALLRYGMRPDNQKGYRD
jgi:deoxyribodipyrimidine photo-lyase